MHIVTAGARYFSFEDRMPREAMNLGKLGFVAIGTHVWLRQRVQYFLLYGMRFMTIGTGNAVRFVLASRPMGTSKNVCFVAREAGCIPCRYGRQILGFGCKHHLRRLAARIALMRGTLTMTALATGSTPVALHTMLRLVDGEDRFCPILIVAHGALLVAIQRSVDLRPCEPRSKEYRDACTDQKESS